MKTLGGKLRFAAFVLLLALPFLYPSFCRAQTARVVPVCSTLPQSYAPGATRDITQDVNGNTCIAGTFSATGGTISNATSGQATTSTNQGAVSYLYGFNGTTWDQLQVDASKFLKINCVTGCAGGAASNATSGVATSSTNGQSVAWLYGFNGLTWDQLQVDASKFLKINCVTGCAGGTFNNNADAVATSATNGQAAAWLYGFNGTTYDRLRADTTNGLWVNVKADATAAALLAAVQAPVPTGANVIGQVGQVSQYPFGAVPITASTTGTTAATTATLAASASIKTYICGFSIRANATAAATANSTVTGTVTGTLNYTQWTAPLASGLGITEQIFAPCIPSSAINTAIAVISAAPGAGGVVSVSAWGYQL